MSCETVNCMFMTAYFSDRTKDSYLKFEEDLFFFKVSLTKTINTKCDVSFIVWTILIVCFLFLSLPGLLIFELCVCIQLNIS